MSDTTRSMQDAMDAANSALMAAAKMVCGADPDGKEWAARMTSDEPRDADEQTGQEIIYAHLGPDGAQSIADTINAFAERLSQNTPARGEIVKVFAEQAIRDLFLSPDHPSTQLHSHMHMGLISDDEDEFGG